MKKEIATLTLFLLVIAAFAQEAKIDSTYGTNGFIATPVGGSVDGGNVASIRTLLLQTDGNIVAAGICGTANDSFYTYCVARYLPNGSLDVAFNDSGKVIYPAGHLAANTYAAAALLQSDGKIVQAGSLLNTVTGYSDFALLRYTTTGKPDNTFGNNGVATLAFGNNAVALSVTVDSAGRILEGGYVDEPGIYSTQFVIARFNTDGSADATFGAGGQVVFSDTTGSYFDNVISALAIQPGGQILAGGSFYDDYNGGGNMRIYRINPNGTIDSTFGVSGSIIGPSYYSSTTAQLVTFSNGRFLALAYADTGSMLYRFNANGTADPTFGSGGSTIITDNGFAIPVIEQVIIGADSSIFMGGILSAAYSYSFILAHCYSNGILDTAFGPNYPLVYADNQNFNDGYSIVQLPDGKILEGGDGFRQGFTLCRFIIDLTLGVADITPNATSLLIYPNPVTGPVTLQYELTTGQKVSIQLLDMQGRLVSILLNNVFCNPGTNNEALQLPANAAAGEYLLKVLTGTGQATIKIVKGQ